jgi:hypothetical protein
MLIIRTDLENTRTQDDIIQSFSTPQLLPTLLVPLCSRPASTQFDSPLPSHLQLDSYDLAELSHEDGLQLIDEMYSAQHPDFIIKDMDTSDDEMYYVPAETQYDLEQAHNMINEINEIMQNIQKGTISDSSPNLSPQRGATSVDLHDSKKIDIKANMIEAKELLQRAQPEPEKLRHTRQEMEPQFLWSLENYSTRTQIKVESGL